MENDMRFLQAEDGFGRAHQGAVGKDQVPAKQGGQQLPSTVALAAPTTPQSKTMMNSASSKILATAPTPVTHMPKNRFARHPHKITEELA